MTDLPVYDSRARASTTGYIAEIWRFRAFILHMSSAMLRSRLRRSMLGIIWIILEPMILAGIFTFVFGKLFKVDDIVAFAIYILIGHIFFTLFTQSVNVSTGAFLDGKAYMQQSRVPAAAFPIRTMLYLFVCFLYAFAGVAVVGFATGRMVFSAHLLWLAPMMLLFMFMLFPMAIISAIANIKFGDFKQIAQYLLTVLYYITPVFLPREFFDDPQVAVLEFTSPTIAVLDIFRDILMEGSNPSYKDMLVLAIWGIILWIIASFWMKREEDNIVYYA